MERLNTEHLQRIVIEYGTFATDCYQLLSLSVL